MKSILLFNTYDLMSVLENQRTKISEVVSKISEESISEGSVTEIESTVLKDIQIDPIMLTEDEISVDQTETKIDVSRDPMRAIFDRSRPFLIEGIKVTYYLPFTGDSELFKCRPNQFNLNPPRANRITKNELIFEFNVIDGKVSETKPAFERVLSDLRLWVGWVNNQVGQFNESIKEPLRLKINSRRQLIDESSKQIYDLGFKVRPKIEVSAESLPQENDKKKQKTPPSSKKVSKKTPTYDVALSFAGEDREYVEEVAQILRNKGINVFYDNFNKVDLWGRNLIDHLGKVYSEYSRFIVMFISKYYAEKTWTNHERKFAQDRAFKMKEECILPARFDMTEIQGLPNSIGYIDLQRTTPKELADLIEEKINIS